MATPATAGPAHRVSSAVEEYGFPNGHMGHLSDEQQRALEEFKELCIEKGYYDPEGQKKHFGTGDEPSLL
jgi:hypothetical protein